MDKPIDKMNLLQKKRFYDKLQISSQELSHLGVAWLLFILAFVPMSIYRFRIDYSDESTLFLTISLMAFAIGFSFIFHELGHKFSAQCFNAKAEFKLDQRGLLITVVSIALGFYLLAPGAVFWNSNLSKYSNIRGRVSASGPIVNLHLASISLGLFIFQGAPTGSIEWMLFTFGYISFYLNVYLGLFNMLPVWILDGKKIFEWSEMVWLAYITMFIILILAFRLVFTGPEWAFNFFIISI